LKIKKQLLYIKIIFSDWVIGTPVHFGGMTDRGRAVILKFNFSKSCDHKKSCFSIRMFTLYTCLYAVRVNCNLGQSWIAIVAICNRQLSFSENISRKVRSCSSDTFASKGRYIHHILKPAFFWGLKFVQILMDFGGKI
jgi:hypothetical protein